MSFDPTTTSSAGAHDWASLSDRARADCAKYGIRANAAAAPVMASLPTVVELPTKAAG